MSTAPPPPPTPPSSSTLYAYVAAAAAAVRGFDWQLTDFRFAGAPLSHGAFPIAGMFAYLALIFALRRFMLKRRPLRLKGAVFAHNVFLCALSVAMFAGTAYEVVARALRFGGVLPIVCDHTGGVMTGRLLMWEYVFYASKYYELLDTVIMVLRKRPLSFLHVYHHCVVLPLFWVYLKTDMVIHFILVIANSLVHVFMYYYYAVASIGKSVWWKRHLTMAQIIQFVIDLTATYPFVFYYYSHPLGCSGSMHGFIFGQVVGISFFYLFVDFFRQSYVRKKEQQHMMARKAAELAANEAAFEVNEGDGSGNETKRRGGNARRRRRRLRRDGDGGGVDHDSGGAEQLPAYDKRGGGERIDGARHRRRHGGEE